VFFWMRTIVREDNNETVRVEVVKADTEDIARGYELNEGEMVGAITSVTYPQASVGDPDDPQYVPGVNEHLDVDADHQILWEQANEPA